MRSSAPSFTTAARAGLHRVAWRSSASALLHGPTPVAEGLDRCQELLGEATDRAGRANVLASWAGSRLWTVGSTKAQRHVQRPRRPTRRWASVYRSPNNSGRVLGRVELLAGDSAAAERVFRDCCEISNEWETLPGLRRSRPSSPTPFTGKVATTRPSLARPRAEALRSDDVSAQWTWRRVRAKLLARDGAFAKPRGSETRRRDSRHGRMPSSITAPSCSISRRSCDSPDGRGSRRPDRAGLACSSARVIVVAA